jgi:hypothetical protein
VSRVLGGYECQRVITDLDFGPSPVVGEGVQSEQADFDNISAH